MASTADFVINIPFTTDFTFTKFPVVALTSNALALEQRAQNLTRSAAKHRATALESEAEAAELFATAARYREAVETLIEVDGIAPLAPTVEVTRNTPAGTRHPSETFLVKTTEDAK